MSNVGNQPLMPLQFAKTLSGEHLLSSRLANNYGFSAGCILPLRHYSRFHRILSQYGEDEETSGDVFSLANVQPRGEEGRKEDGAAVTG